jgi:signal transduction histidine kinase
VLTNALKFTDTGGSVDIAATVADGFAQVTVRDTGSGIASTVLPQVFDPFRQGSASAAGQQGLGLGLNIARVIVELHGGTIQIASPGEGRGTTCTINLPVRMDPERPVSRVAVTKQ